MAGRPLKRAYALLERAIRLHQPEAIYSLAHRIAALHARRNPDDDEYEMRLRVLAAAQKALAAEAEAAGHTTTSGPRMSYVEFLVWPRGALTTGGTSRGGGKSWVQKLLDTSPQRIYFPAHGDIAWDDVKQGALQILLERLGKDALRSLSVWKAQARAALLESVKLSTRARSLDVLADASPVHPGVVGGRGGRGDRGEFTALAYGDEASGEEHPGMQNIRALGVPRDPQGSERRRNAVTARDFVLVNLFLDTHLTKQQSTAFILKYAVFFHELVGVLTAQAQDAATHLTEVEAALKRARRDGLLAAAAELEWDKKRLAKAKAMASTEAVLIEGRLARGEALMTPAMLSWYGDEQVGGNPHGYRVRDIAKVTALPPAHVDIAANVLKDIALKLSDKEWANLGLEFRRTTTRKRKPRGSVKRNPRRSRRRRSGG
jgi:hypothetical protein